MISRPLARLLGIVGIVAVVGFLVPAWHRSEIGWLPDVLRAHDVSFAAEPGYPAKNKLTSVLAHAPGFTVFENL